jgi:hypothetical protein
LPSLHQPKRRPHFRRLAGLTNPRCPPLIFDRRPPDLLASCNVEGKRPVSIHDVHHAVVDRRLRHFAGVVAEVVLQIGTSRLTFDLLIWLSGLYWLR